MYELQVASLLKFERSMAYAPLEIISEMLLYRCYRSNYGINQLLCIYKGVCYVMSAASVPHGIRQFVWVGDSETLSSERISFAFF